MTARNFEAVKDGWTAILKTSHMVDTGAGPLCDAAQQLTISFHDAQDGAQCFGDGM